MPLIMPLHVALFGSYTKAMLLTYSFAYVSAHIFFDDAFESHLDDTFEYRVNPFVKMMVGLINKAARYLDAS